MTSERRGWRDHPLVQLTLVRYREFFREPEAVFWVFVFPVLLTAGLGIAFRNQAPERTPVAVVARGDGHRSGGRTRSRGAPDIQVARAVSEAAAAEALRTGRWRSWSCPPPDGQVEYRFDDTRPESRIARLLVDDALQRAAGRQRSGRGDATGWCSERGSRYIDFLVPGLLG